MTAPTDTLPGFLFLVTDGTICRLMTGWADDQGKAECLVTAAAIDEHDADPEFLGAEFLGRTDTDIDRPVGDQG